MSIQDSYLFPTLEAGLSRVFNISLRTTQLMRQAEQGDGEAGAEPLFKTRDLNRVILIKEARPSRKAARYTYANAVGTKLYFPYNDKCIYDGGKSVFVDDPQIRLVLKQHAGLDPNGGEAADRDFRILGLLDQLPSLDPFLVRDRLEIEGITVNEFYFQIPDGEWKAIQQHVSEKLKPIITFAYPESETVERGRINLLMNKLWNTKDIDALMPIVKAFGLPEEEASGIFSAWKGIMYYDYEYARCRQDWEKSLDWLKNDAIPTDFVDAERRSLLGSLAEAVRARYGEAWHDLEEILSSYETAYDNLFVKRQDSAPFIKFMRDAVRVYWILGSRMSAISHSAAVWEILTAGSFRRRLKYEPLYNLLELQREIFEQTLATT